MQHVVSLVDTTCPALWFELEGAGAQEGQHSPGVPSVASPHNVPGKTESVLDSSSQAMTTKSSHLSFERA